MHTIVCYLYLKCFELVSDFHLKVHKAKFIKVLEVFGFTYYYTLIVHKYIIALTLYWWSWNSGLAIAVVQCIVLLFHFSQTRLKRGTHSRAVGRSENPVGRQVCNSRPIEGDGLASIPAKWGQLSTNVSSVVEFQRWWVLKSKIFGQESTYSKEKN